MRKPSSLWGLAVFCSGLVACTDDEDPAGAATLWEQVHRDEYRNWDRAPGYEERRKTRAPHGDSVDIYVNDVVAEALASNVDLEAWPVGSLIVKDGFDGHDLELVAVMEKRDDGWFWAEYDDEGDAAYSGTPELCIDCHESGDDGVRAFALPSRP